MLRAADLCDLRGQAGAYPEDVCDSEASLGDEGSGGGTPITGKLRPPPRVRFYTTIAKPHPIIQRGLREGISRREPEAKKTPQQLPEARAGGWR